MFRHSQAANPEAYEEVLATRSGEYFGQGSQMFLAKRDSNIKEVLQRDRSIYLITETGRAKDGDELGGAIKIANPERNLEKNLCEDGFAFPNLSNLE